MTLQFDSKGKEVGYRELEIMLAVPSCLQRHAIVVGATVNCAGEDSEGEKKRGVTQSHHIEDLMKQSRGYSNCNLDTSQQVAGRQ